MTSESPQSDSNLKSLILKGLVGAVSLAGATAIPIVVQRALETPPATNAAPAAQVEPAPTPTVEAMSVEPASVQPTTQTGNRQLQRETRRPAASVAPQNEQQERKRRKPKDDDDDDD